MKKSAKGIIGLGALLVVLGGGITALMLTDPKEEENGSESESGVPEQQVQVLIRDDKVTGTDPETGADLEGVIKTVDVKNSTGELRVVQREPEEGSTAVTYTFDGYTDVYMNTAMIGTLAHNANGLTSEAVVEENCSDPAKFGFDDPEVVVDIVYETGTSYRMLIGDEAPVGSVSYVMIDGIDTVFTVRDSALANYRKPLTDFVESTVLKMPDEQPVVQSLRIERDDLEKGILIEYDKKGAESENSGGTSSPHIMTEPTFAYLALERSADIVSGMFGLYADSIYSVHCSDSDIAEAGLQKPFCTVTMKCDDGSEYTLLLSEPFADDNGKSCYGMMKDGNVIFTIDAEDAKWVTVQPVDIASRIFIASYVWNVPKLKITCGSEEYAFDIERIDPDEEVSSLTASNFKVTLNGEEFDSERYRKFYSFLLSANAEDFALDEEIPNSEPLATITLKDNFTGETTEYGFYEKSSLKALITVNGESKFTITKSYVETLTENAKNLDSDTEFKTTWK